MAGPILAWLTDFGTRDHYVGTMKGVALGIAPEATLVDITHEIAPQDVVGGALELAAAHHYFPRGTIFVAVVDPGVGSSRRALAAHANGYFFVAPDNGLLMPVLAGADAQVVELTRPELALPAVSRTFEGRDRFAPAAAWLARGVALAEFGPAVPDWQRLTLPEPHVDQDRIAGEVVRVDRFGNAITNLPRTLIESWLGGRTPVIGAGTARLSGIVPTYAAGGGPCALFSSSDHLEIAVAGGSAAVAFGLGRGTVVTIARSRRVASGLRACQVAGPRPVSGAAPAGWKRRVSIRRLPAC